MLKDSFTEMHGPHDQRGQLAKIWLILRILTAVIALISSVLNRPGAAEFGHFEMRLPIWPPSRPIASWIGRIFVGPWARGDAEYYVSAVSNGFSIHDGTASFHPLLVWLSVPVYLISGSPLFGLLLVASVSTLLLYIAIERLARLDLPQEEAKRATLLFALYPLSYVFFAPYTESTFLLFAVLLFLCARRRMWLSAGLCGAAATLTRQQGLFLLVPLAWELWESKEFRLRNLASLSFIPLAYLFWIAYRTFALSDSTPDLSSFQAIIYSVLLSPSAHKVVADQAFLLPPKALHMALLKLWYHPTVPILIDLTMAAIFITMTVLAWRNMRASYRLYTFIIILVSLSYYTGLVNDSTYMGLPRHLLLAFPVFIGIAPRITDYAASKLYKVCFFSLLLFTYFHCMGVWVP
jgi:hypothetical protein